MVDGGADGGAVEALGNGPTRAEAADVVAVGIALADDFAAPKEECGLHGGVGVDEVENAGHSAGGDILVFRQRSRQRPVRHLRRLHVELERGGIGARVGR